MGRRGPKRTHAAGFEPPPSTLDLYGTGEVEGLSLSFASRKNRCYELAAYALVFGAAPADALLVHGSIDGGEGTLGRIGHAWLRLPGGRIWEPISYRLYGSEWTEWSQAQPEVSYSKATARDLIFAVGTFGPWHDESKHRVLSPGEVEARKLLNALDV